MAQIVQDGKQYEIVKVSGSISTTDGFSIPAYDYVSMSYTNDNLTEVVYKTGGSNGTTVATLTLTYNGSNKVTSITKS